LTLTMGCCTSTENMNVTDNPSSTKNNKIASQLRNHQNLQSEQHQQPVEKEKDVQTKIVVSEVATEIEEDKPKQDRMNTMIELPEPSLNEDSDYISSVHTSPTTKIGNNPKFHLDVEEPTSPLETPKPEVEVVVVTPCYTPIIDRLDLNADEHRLKFQIQMEVAETEEKFERERKKHLRNETFDVQLKTQRSQRYDSLYQVFDRYAIGDEKDKMDIDGLSKALAVFGMVIDSDRDLQKFVLKKFDLDNNGEIDYNDFSSTMSAIIASQDDESLLLLFQIFDIDSDGYLELEDVARLLLSVNQIAVVATKGQQNKSIISYTKRQCLKQANRLMKQQNKVSFEQFKDLMMNKTEKDLMIDHMVQPSISYNIEAPRVSGLI